MGSAARLFSGRHKFEFVVWDYQKKVSHSCIDNATRFGKGDLALNHKRNTAGGLQVVLVLSASYGITIMVSKIST